MVKSRFSSCHGCDDNAEFRCTVCDKLLCGRHSKFRVICRACITSNNFNYSIRSAHSKDTEILKELVLFFWGDLEQQMFSKRYVVTDTPALVATQEEGILGFIFYTLFDLETVLIVALGVRPEYQGGGVGHALVKAVEEITIEKQRSQLLVVTSNDDLPALAFYQRLGFQLFEVAPDVVAEKLGEQVLGIGNIPVRDELRLRKVIK